MREVLYEESAKIQNEKSAAIKYYVLKTMSILSYVLMTVWILIVYFAFDFGAGNIILNLIIVLFPIALFIASGIILGRFKNRFYLDYDYIFVSGSIRFSKVIKNVNRKFIIKFDCAQIEKIGKIVSGTFQKYSNMQDIKKYILTSNVEPADGKDFFYIVANVDEEKRLFVLECSEAFMINVLKFSNRSILEEDYGK